MFKTEDYLGIDLKLTFQSSLGGKTMFKFDFDTTRWYFPICFQYQTVGNNRRPWTLQIGFLCFNFIICIDEDSR